MSYNAMDVANYVINYCNDNHIPVSNLKLQKLLYYIQVAFLVEKNKEAFADKICAWTYGPVVEEVYHRFKIYVNRPIDKISVSKDGSLFLECLDEYSPLDYIHGKDATLIDKVIASYRKMPALAMVSKTHNEDPWKEAHERCKPFIDNEAIKEFYSYNEGLIYGE